MNSAFDQLLAVSPADFADQLTEEFIEDIPVSIETAEELRQLSEIMNRTVNRYSYMEALLSYVKIRVREAKRGQDKSFYEDMVDRKEAVQNTADVLKMQYQAMSRAITVRQQIIDELHMSDEAKL